jgi:hypothetical protein
MDVPLASYGNANPYFRSTGTGYLKQKIRYYDHHDAEYSGI